MPTDFQGSSLPAPPRAVRRRALSPAVMTVFSFVGAALIVASNSAVTPLYRLYQQSMHLTPLVITLVYAVYTFSLLAALLTVGGLSDYVGRRPVILSGLLLNAIASAVIGGVSLFGGRGEVRGALLGALLIGTLAFKGTLIAQSGTLEAEICGGRNGTVSCWVHRWPLLSIPLKTNTRFTGTVSPVERIDAESVPCAARMLLPVNQAQMMAESVFRPKSGVKPKKMPMAEPRAIECGVSAIAINVM